MPQHAGAGHKGTIFPESKLAHEILDGLEGLEIGAAAHNPFGLATRNVGLSREDDPVDFDFFQQSQLEMCGAAAPIDIAADAAALPLPANATDFVLHSHVWEHLPNPLAALEEWVRVTKHGGFIFAIVPKRNAAPADLHRPVTSLAELIDRHRHPEETLKSFAAIAGNSRGHHTIFAPELLRAIGGWFNRTHFSCELNEVAFQETDDKVGNGHSIVWQVRKFSTPESAVRYLTSKLRRR